ncbi:MAG: hypothetical protein ABSE73_24755 [Planctomycetota bacterium]
MTRTAPGLPPEEEDEVTRCRRVREEFDKRFKTLDEMFDYCARLHKQHEVRIAKARANRKPKKVASNGKPAPRKPVHK